MKKIMSFVIRNSYNNARKIADYIIISMMKYPNPKNRYNPTYTSSIKLCKARHVIFLIKDISDTTDEDESFYRITIYKIDGNRKSILSPSQNQIYDNIIAVDNLSEIMNKLENR